MFEEDVNDIVNINRDRWLKPIVKAQEGDEIKFGVNTDEINIEVMKLAHIFEHILKFNNMK